MKKVKLIEDDYPLVKKRKVLTKEEVETMKDAMEFFNNMGDGRNDHLGRNCAKLERGLRKIVDRLG